ncbi:hypothetical protein MNBD_DELTA01-466 [hydrothermal vent metagenome]|uniref:Transporter n=1 Tax=hydrothermal vent metagenome TaxID=652676 RepID=A0A3B0R820_9ZZZZ
MNKLIFVFCSFLFIAATVMPGLGERSAEAVNYREGAHPPSGFYLSLYPFWSNAEVITDDDGDKAVRNLGLDYYGVIIRPIYYTKNFIFTPLIPVAKLEVDSKGESSSGLGDITLGAGYFLPVEWVNLLSVIQIKTDTGPYDKDDAVNLGSGQWDIKFEQYLHKMFDRWSIDAAIKYWVKYENKSNGWKPGNELRLESVATYGFTRKLRFGPTVTLIRGSDGEMRSSRIDNTAKKKLSLGGELYYRARPKLGITLTYMKDIETRNSIEGEFLRLRISMAF